MSLSANHTELSKRLSQKDPTLTHFSLDDTQLSYQTFGVLTQGLIQSGQVQHLSLRNIIITQEDKRIITHSRKAHTATMWSGTARRPVPLSDNWDNPNGEFGHILAQIVQANPNLTTICLTGVSQFESLDLRALTAVIPLAPAIDKITIQNRGKFHQADYKLFLEALIEKGRHPFKESKEHKSHLPPILPIRCLQLSLDAEGIDPLNEMLANPQCQLKELIVNIENGTLLARGLARNRTLNSLVIDKQTDEDIRKLLSALKDNNELRVLELRDGEIVDSTVPQLVEFTKQHPNLYVIDLEGNEITDIGATLICTALREREVPFFCDLSDNRIENRKLFGEMRVIVLDKLVTIPAEKLFDFFKAIQIICGDKEDFFYLLSDGFEPVLLSKLLDSLVCLQKESFVECFKLINNSKRIDFLYALNDMYDQRNLPLVTQMTKLLSFLAEGLPHEPSKYPFKDCFSDPIVQSLFFRCAAVLDNEANAVERTQQSSLYSLLAHFGNPHAQYNYAIIRQLGSDGQPRDKAEAEMWRERAVLQGVPAILNDLFPLVTQLAPPAVKVKVLEIKEKKQEVAVSSLSTSVSILATPSIQAITPLVRDPKPRLVSVPKKEKRRSAISIYFEALSSPENAYRILTNPELCKQLETRQMVKVLGHIEDSKTVIEVLTANITRLHENDLICVVRNRYALKSKDPAIAIWVQNDCPKKLNSEHLAQIVQPFPVLARKLWDDLRSKGELSNACLLSLSLSDNGLALEIYQERGKQFSSLELGRIGEKYISFAKAAVEEVLGNWEEATCSNAFVVTVLSYWVQHHEIATYVLDHQAFKASFSKNSDAAFAIITDIGRLHPQLVSQYFLVLPKQVIQHWVHDVEIAIHLMTHPKLTPYLDGGLLTDIAIEHPELGSYILKEPDLMKLLSPLDFIKIGQASLQYAETILENGKMRCQLNEWQLLTVCRGYAHLKKKLINYGQVKNIFPDDLSWSDARKISLNPHAKYSIDGLYIIGFTYPDIGRMLYRLPHLMKTSQQFSKMQQVSLACDNLYIANHYFEKDDDFFPEFSDNQVGRILGSHQTLLHQLCNEDQIHSGVARLNIAAIKDICLSNLDFSTWVFYSKAYEDMFVRLTPEYLVEICIKHSSLAIQFFQDRAGNKLSDNKASFLKKLPLDLYKKLASELPDIRGILGLDISVEVKTVDASHFKKSQPLDSKVISLYPDRRKHADSQLKSRFYPFEQSILKKLSKSVDPLGSCAGFVIAFLRDTYDSKDFKVTLQRVKEGNIDEIDKINFLQDQQDLYKQICLYRAEIIEGSDTLQRVNDEVRKILALLVENQSLYLSIKGQHAVGLFFNSVTKEIYLLEPNKGLAVFSEVDINLVSELTDRIGRKNKASKLNLVVFHMTPAILKIPTVLQAISFATEELKSLGSESKVSKEMTVVTVRQVILKLSQQIVQQTGKKEDDEAFIIQANKLKALSETIMHSQQETEMCSVLKKSFQYMDFDPFEDKPISLSSVIEQHTLALSFLKKLIFPADSLWQRDLVRIQLHRGMCYLQLEDKEKALLDFQAIEKCAHLLTVYELPQYCCQYLKLINDSKITLSMVNLLVNHFLDYAKSGLVSNNQNINKYCGDVFLIVLERYSPERALQCLQPLIKFCKMPLGIFSDSFVIGVMFKQAELYEKSGDISNGFTVLNEIQNTRWSSALSVSNMAKLHQARGNCYAAQNLLAKAEIEWRLALRLFPYPECGQQRWGCYRALGAAPNKMISTLDNPFRVTYTKEQFLALLDKFAQVINQVMVAGLTNAPEKYYQLANEMLQAGLTIEAREIYLRILPHYCAITSESRILADIYYKLGHLVSPTDKLKYFNKAYELETDPCKKVTIQFHRAPYLPENKDDKDQEIHEYEKCLEDSSIDPQTFTEVLFKLSAKLFAVDDWDACVKYADLYLLKVKPNADNLKRRIQVEYWRAYSLLFLAGQSQRALALQKLLAYKPETLKRSHRASCYREISDYNGILPDEHEQLLVTAQNIDDLLDRLDYEDCAELLVQHYMKIGLLGIRLGYDDDALYDFNQAINIATLYKTKLDPICYASRATIYKKSKMLAESAQDLTSAINLLKEEKPIKDICIAKLYIRYAHIQLEFKEQKSAEESLNQALKLRKIAKPVNLDLFFQRLEIIIMKRRIEDTSSDCARLREAAAKYQQTRLLTDFFVIVDLLNIAKLDTEIFTLCNLMFTNGSFNKEANARAHFEIAKVTYSLFEKLSSVPFNRAEALQHATQCIAHCTKAKELEFASSDLLSFYMNSCARFIEENSPASIASRTASASPSVASPGLYG